MPVLKCNYCSRGSDLVDFPQVQQKTGGLGDLEVSRDCTVEWGLPKLETLQVTCIQADLCTPVIICMHAHIACRNKYSAYFSLLLTWKMLPFTAKWRLGHANRFQNFWALAKKFGHFLTCHGCCSFTSKLWTGNLFWQPHRLGWPIVTRPHKNHIVNFTNQTYLIYLSRFTQK